jgi:hypothetical protein
MKSASTLLAVVVLLQLALLVVVLIQRRRQKAHQEELVSAVSGYPFWRIAIARPGHLARLWKLNPIQALGVLIDEGSTVRLKGRWPDSREVFDVIVPKTETHYPTWQGSLPLRAGSFAWAKFCTPSGDLMVTADTGFQTLSSRQALTDILRSAFPRFALPVEAKQDFALEKNRVSLTAVVVMFALALFAILDTYIFSGYELIDSQIYDLARNPMLMAVAGILLLATGTASYAVLRGAKVPARESWALAILVAAAAAIATPPALKRVDQLWAPTSSATLYRYRVAQPSVTLQPVDQSLDLPTLRFTRAHEYWAQYAVGAEVEIPLLRGPLGLWQLDHHRFDPPIKTFYKKTSSQ